MPRTCSVCGRRLSSEEEVFCTACLLHLPMTHFIDAPYDNELAQVFWGRVKPFHKAFALLYHFPQANSARAVYLLKYYRGLETGYAMGHLMGKLMAEHGFFDDIDALVPMPLAGNRQRPRGYNQSVVLCEGMADIVRLPILKRAVRRTKFKDSQTHKNVFERIENVEGAFRLMHPEQVSGKHLLIVDDVVTTGATVCALAKELSRAPGVSFSVAAFSFAGSWH